MNLDHMIKDKIIELSQKHQLSKVVLFGSRAKGTNSTVSDIDLAVWGVKTPAQYLDYKASIEEDIPTLLMFDIVDMESYMVSDTLREEIRKDGITLYEKV